MKPRAPVFVLAPLALIGALVVAASAAAHGGPGYREHRGRALYFAIGCGFSHRNNDDAIVSPGRTGVSHNHTYFGNASTNASSTPASLRASGSTTCALRADTAAYWMPTLLVSGQAVEPRAAVVYYVRRTFEPVQAFPAGLKMVAGNAAASSAQSQRVTYWTCSRSRIQSSTVPTCFEGRRTGLRLVVNFPNCWDGRRLDSANHKSHMAYSVEGFCPPSHPVEVPALSIVVRYSVAGGSGVELASGGQFSGHGDFINAWNQDVLRALVNRYLNGGY
jgi:Domain of unknown function (DUF1996)